MTDLKPLMLMLADGEFHSGETLGESLGLTRAAIWKRLQSLEELGLCAESVKGKGYRLKGGMDFLEPELVCEQLSNETSKTFDIEFFEEIASTNEYLLRGKEAANSVCVAERQTAGRGRRGRSWVSPYGKNLYLSLSWSYHQGVSVVEGLSLAVGVELADLLAELGLLDIQLKWPNDLLWQDRKLGGVLVEIGGDVSGDCRVVVGLGLNVSMSESLAEDTDLIEKPWVDLHTAGLSVQRSVLCGRIIDRVGSLLRDYPDRGFSYYRDQWQSYNAHAGKLVVLESPTGSTQGLFQQVDERGAILLQTDEGLQAFVGGEVSLRSHDS